MAANEPLVAVGGLVGRCNVGVVVVVVDVDVVVVVAAGAGADADAVKGGIFLFVIGDKRHSFRCILFDGK